MKSLITAAAIFAASGSALAQQPARMQCAGNSLIQVGIAAVIKGSMYQISPGPDNITLYSSKGVVGHLSRLKDASGVYEGDGYTLTNPNATVVKLLLNDVLAADMSCVPL